MGYGEACLRDARFMITEIFCSADEHRYRGTWAFFFPPWCFGDSGACLHALLRPVELARRLGDLKPGGYRARLFQCKVAKLDTSSFC